MYKLLIVGLGGFLGSIARFVSLRTIDERLNSLFPYGTLIVNLIGSFILGMVYTLAVRKAGFSEHARIFWGAGVCGGFTTFSTFAWENFNLLEQKNFGVASLYIVGSLVLGIMSVLLGIWAARSF